MKPRRTATPEQAMGMLAREVAAVQADKTKALAMFTTGEGGFLDEDLYPYCFNVGDGRIVADVNEPKLIGQKAMDLKDATGKPFGLELYKAAQKSEGEITDVSYMFPEPGSEQQLAPKVAFVTRVGDCLRRRVLKIKIPEGTAVHRSQGLNLPHLELVRSAVTPVTRLRQATASPTTRKSVPACAAAETRRPRSDCGTILGASIRRKYPLW